MAVEILDERGLLILRTKGIKNLSMSDFVSLIYSLEFYMSKNVEFDEHIDGLENSFSKANKYIVILQNKIDKLQETKWKKGI